MHIAHSQPVCPARMVRAAGMQACLLHACKEYMHGAHTYRARMDRVNEHPKGFWAVWGGLLVVN